MHPRPTIALTVLVAVGLAWAPAVASAQLDDPTTLPKRAPPPADPDPNEPPPAEQAPAPGSQIGEADAVSFKLEQPRTTKQLIVLGSLAGGAVLFGGAGVLFHLDSKSKSDEVSRLGELTGLVWTAEREDTRKGALRSRQFAIGGYAIGGAFVVATIVALIVTEPEDKVVTYGVVPTDGGAFASAGWSF